METDVKTESSTVTEPADRMYADSPVLPEAESAPASPKSEVEAKAETETASGSEPEKTEPKEDSPKAKARIKELLAEKKRLESELEAARQEAVKPPAKREEAAVAQFPELGFPPVKPRKEDFEDWEKYEAAKDDYAEKLLKYETKRAILQDRMERDEAAAQAREEQIRQTNQKLWNEREAQSKKLHPDFDKVIYNDEGTVEISDVPLNRVVNDFIMDSEIGPEILYHLKKNLDDAARIADMGPLQTARAMTMLETEILDKIKAPKKTTTLPKPPADLGGTATTTHRQKTDVEVMYGTDA